MAQVGADPRQKALTWQEWSYSTATLSCTPPSPLQGAFAPENRMKHSDACHHHGSLQQSSPNSQDTVSHKKKGAESDSENGLQQLFWMAVPSSSWAEPLGLAQATLISPSQTRSQGTVAKDRSMN